MHRSRPRHRRLPHHVPFSRSTVISAAIGGVLLPMIKGLTIMLNRFISGAAQSLQWMKNLALTGTRSPMVFSATRYLPQVLPPPPVEESAAPSSWFGGILVAKVDVKSSGGGRRMEILESFDSPSWQVPTFDNKKNIPGFHARLLGRQRICLLWHQQQQVAEKVEELHQDAYLMMCCWQQVLQW